MSDILLFWLWASVVFIIIEVLTATFYGLSLALASCMVIVYVLITGDSQFELLQAVIFLFGSALFAYLLPKLLQSDTPDVPQGADRYKGMTRTVKRVGGDFKISLDGVDYLIESDEEIKAGDKVEIISHAGVSMKVKKYIGK